MGGGDGSGKRVMEPRNFTLLYEPGCASWPIQIEKREITMPPLPPMQDQNAESVAAATSDFSALGMQLCTIVGRLLDDHNNWAIGYLQWASQMTMSMGGVPPEAQMELPNKQAWLILHLRQFESVAAILSKYQQHEFPKLLGEAIVAIETQQRRYQETLSNIAADNLAAQNSMAGFQRQAAINNQAGFDQRLALQKSTNEYVQKSFSDTLKARQDSFDQINQRISRAILG